MTKNRIDTKLEQVKAAGKKALIPFVQLEMAVMT